MSDQSLFNLIFDLKLKGLIKYRQLLEEKIVFATCSA